jgi:transcriptional regulator with XRE-family HTH domain
VNFSYLSKLENGHEEPPSEDTLRRLAVELKVSEDRLLAMAGKLPAELRERAGADPEFAYLLTRLPDVSKRSLNRIFKAAGIEPPRFP